MKLGVITDGISRDLDHALSVMDEFDLDYAELQFINDKEVGDMDRAERASALELIKRHEKKVSCISRHLFAGMPMATSKPGDELHTKHMDALKRCIDMAHEFDCPLVRIMTGKKEMILWGLNGAEKWNVAPRCMGRPVTADCACSRTRQTGRDHAGGGNWQRHNGQFLLYRAKTD